MPSVLVLIGLAIVWAIVIFPDVARWVSQNRRGDSIRTFNTQLSSLGRSRPAGDNVIDLRDRMVRPVAGGSGLRAPARNSRSTSPGPTPIRSAATAAPPAASAPRALSPTVRKRRQDVLVSLGAASLLTLLATIAFGPFFLYVHLLTDALLVGYLVLLQRATTAAGGARSDVAHRVADPARDIASPAVLGSQARVMEPRRIAN